MKPAALRDDEAALLAAIVQRADRRSSDKTQARQCQIYGPGRLDLLRARVVQTRWKRLPISTKNAPEPKMTPYEGDHPPVGVCRSGSESGSARKAARLKEDREARRRRCGAGGPRAPRPQRPIGCRINRSEGSIPIIKESGNPGPQVRPGVFGIAFPDRHDAPPEPLKVGNRPPVPLDVLGELVGPEYDSGFWRRAFGAPDVTVPETAVHEYRYSPSGKGEIRRARKIAPVQPIAKAEPMDQLSDLHLGLRVLAPDPRHVLGSRDRGDAFRLHSIPLADTVPVRRPSAS